VCVCVSVYVGGGGGWMGVGVWVCVLVAFHATLSSLRLNVSETKTHSLFYTQHTRTRIDTRTRKQRTKTTTSIFFPASLCCCFLPMKITSHLCHHVCLVRRQEIHATFAKTNCIFFWGDLEKFCPDFTIWIRKSCPMPNKTAFFLKGS